MMLVGLFGRQGAYRILVSSAFWRVIGLELIR